MNFQSSGLGAPANAAEPLGAGVGEPSSLSVALVGAGRQGSEVLLPALRELPGVNIAAVCDPVTERASVAGGGVAVRSLQEAVEMVPLQAAVVACPPAVHRSTIEFALRRGLPVFVEKPPTILSGELIELVQLAQARSGLVGVGMNFRYAAAIQRVSRLLAEGSLGKLASLTIRHLANKPRSSLWGLSPMRSLLLAQAIHPIDLAVWLAGEVESDRTEIFSSGSACTIAAALVHTGGTHTSITISTAAPRFSFHLSAVTDKGAVIECSNLAEVTIEGGPDASADGWAERWVPGPLERGYRRGGYSPELAAFFEAVGAGTGFRPGLGDLLPTYHLLDAIEDASGAG